MKCLILTLLVLVAVTASAHAQDPFDGALPPIQPQAEARSWELQDPRFDTPKQAVRRKAAWKAAQRRERLATMKRLGYSPSRPPTTPIPVMGSPTTWRVIPAFYPIVYYPRVVAGIPDRVR